MPQDDGDAFEQLSSLLDAARDIARELVDDRLFGRLVEVFARMPEGDREVIVGALEREVRTRLLSQDVATDLTQISLRPNPNARLYFRVVEPEDKRDDVEMTAFLRAVYSVQRGIDALDPAWRTMVVTALRYMDPAARATIDGFNRTIRELLDEAAALGEVADPPADPDPVAPTAKDVSGKG